MSHDNATIETPATYKADAIFDQFDSQFNSVFDGAMPSLADAVPGPKLPEKAAPDKTELHQAHATTISASNAHKIMSDLSSPALPASARAYIESMVRGGDQSEVKTPAMQWGIDNEPGAIKALEKHIKTPISFTGEAQKRFYYDDFVSALPDGMIMNADVMEAVVEVKCLNTDNHNQALTINKAVDLSTSDWPKYCQVQCQLLCTGAAHALFAFYDPRHDLPLKIVEIEPDKDWKLAFLSRVDQAKAYYEKIEAEDDSKPAFTESDTPAPEINNLPRVQIELTEVAQYHKTPEQLVAKIQQQAGSFVFDMTTAKGRDACRSHAANIIRCITPALNASKAIAAEAKRVQEADLHFRKIFEQGIRQIADHTRKPLTEWEAEQTRIAEEQARLEAEAIEQQRLEQQYIDNWDAAITANELYDLRKEKAAREAKEQAERQAKEKADYERQLQEQAVERERQRLAKEQERTEAKQRLEAVYAEQQRQAAIARAEQAELQKIQALEQAERDKLATEQREEQARQAAERDAKAREQAAIDNERKRQAEQARLETEEQARIKAEADKQAANRAHRQRINSDIFAKLSDMGIDDGFSKEIIKAAANKRLGALIINY